MKKYPLTSPIFIFAIFLVLLPLSMNRAFGQDTLPLYPSKDYRSDIQSPSDYLGFSLGSRPVHHEEALDYFQYLSDQLPNAQLKEYGKTYEGRTLVYLVISSESNFQRLETIRENIAKLADPRKLQRANPEKIIEQTPAVAWMAYSIHGDELSSTDASLQLAYQLLAGKDDVSKRIREELVVCIDPLQNPDGRERFLAQMRQWKSMELNPDQQSLNHRGLWPWGRGNHYLFDLNRDWFATVHPETRGKVKAILSWNPQFMVDAHEMGAYDTYLFNPPRAPFNPYLPQSIFKWWERLAKDQAVAFDRYGWSYYTREWNEEMYPGYGSSWGIYAGLVGVLYEQAETSGSVVKRPDGTLATFREAVHHQFISSLANLNTVASQRRELLRDYYDSRKAAVDRSNASKAFIFPPGDNLQRLNSFAETLQRQSIEVYQTAQELYLPKARHSTGKTVNRERLPAGSLVVPLNQPLNTLIQNILSFDIRIDTKSLEKERRELLKHKESTIYDVTAWSLPLAFGLEGYYTESFPKARLKAYKPVSRPGNLVNKDARYGFLVAGAEDGVYQALARLLKRGYKVWAAKKAFTIEGQSYPPGTLLLRRSANSDLDFGVLEDIAAATGLDITGVNTALATSGSDLGGGDFTLLSLPRIGLVGGNHTSAYSFGAIWQLLDTRLHSRVSLLNATDLYSTDLRKYNVLILPSLWGGPTTIQSWLGKATQDKLENWVEAGGTLIAIGNAAAFLADTSTGFSQARLRRQVLAQLDAYAKALDQMQQAENPTIDSLTFWEGQVGTSSPSSKSKEAKTNKEVSSDIKDKDILARKLRPQGAILKINLDPDHWLAFGCGSSLPVLFNSGYALMAKDPVQVPARLAEAGTLRISGLLWPEARERLSETAWATREAKGNGQIILFLTQPNFRGYFRGSERLLLNAIYLGPGMGTRQTVEW
jgi:hypothetical protein